jgi:hypothetical protein
VSAGDIRIACVEIRRPCVLIEVNDLQKSYIEDDDSIGIQLKDIGVAYTATVENKIEMIIADFWEVIFKDKLEDIEP